MTDVGLYITGVSRGSGADGKPIVRYIIEDDDGKIGDFVTPVTSRLARVLLERIGEEPPMKLEVGKRMTDLDTGETYEWTGAAWQFVENA